ALSALVRVRRDVNQVELVSDGPRKDERDGVCFWFRAREPDERPGSLLFGPDVDGGLGDACELLYGGAVVRAEARDEHVGFHRKIVLRRSERKRTLWGD